LVQAKINGSSKNNWFSLQFFSFVKPWLI
jgi:hypothetical protein